MPSNSNSTHGAFQRMGLEEPLLQSIFGMKYRLPTPIQRKVIPIIQNKRDVVAMARTGSGKTAAFLIPILNSLAREDKTSRAVVGFQRITAVVISPTRDLARQTYKFARSLASQLPVTVCSISGGESLAKHFDLFTSEQSLPIIIMVTLGRLIQILVEMDISYLPSVRYLVLDEADRLFEEGGFRDQLGVFLTRLSPERQTILLSATMPKVVTDFVRSSLIKQPILCRLDTDISLNPNLKIVYLYCTHDEKLVNLCSIVSALPQLGQILVFVSTRYDADLLSEILKTICKISAVAVYGNSKMDDEARQNALNSFRRKKVKVLVTTDVSARGIDIPVLDTVINYNFPRGPKLFIHRSGRAARSANRNGTVISLVSNDEMPFLYDFHEFINIEFSTKSSTDNFVIGRSNYTDEVLRESISNIIAGELSAEHLRSRNAWKAFLRNAKPPSGSSVDKWKCQKEQLLSEMQLHSIFGNELESNSKKHDFLLQLRKWRGQRTIFEIGSSVQTASIVQAMQNQRIQAKKRRNVAEDTFKDTNYFISYNSTTEQSSDFKIDTFSRDIQKCSLEVGCSGEADDLSKQCSRLNRIVRKQRLVWDKQQKKFVSGNAIADEIASKRSWMYSGAKGKQKGEKYTDWLKKRNNKQRYGGVKQASEIVQKRETQSKKKRSELQRKTKKDKRRKAKQ